MHKKRQYKTGLVIGRFQPFHKGHRYLVKRALDRADEIVIGIGSIGVHNADNPFDEKKRIKMLEVFLDEEKIRNRVKHIVLLADHPDDNIWLANTLGKTGPIDVVIGNNDWVNGIFRAAQYKIVTIGYFHREKLEGLKIRKLMREHKKWEDRVPSYLVAEIKAR